MRTEKCSPIAQYCNFRYDGANSINLKKSVLKKSFEKRAVRSFVRREGRITHGQQEALTKLSEYYVMPDHHQLNRSTFSHVRPLVLEIGFGMGVSLIEMAQQNPDENYLGIEVYRPGAGAFLKRAAELNLDNVKIFLDDAQQVCDRSIPNESLTRVQIFFPDPWPKKRHHKRRLIQTPFVRLLTQKLQVGGVLHMATDVCDYATHMAEVCEELDLQRVDDPSCLGYQRPLTKFESRGLHQGHQIHDLIYRVGA